MSGIDISISSISLLNTERSILGDPGAVSGGGETSSGREKNSGEEKSRRRIRAPGDKVLTDQGPVSRKTR